MGLAHALRAAGKEVRLWPLAVPSRYRFLPGVGELAAKTAPPTRGDVAVALDCADLSRIPADFTAFWRGGGVLLNLDHHISNDGFGTYSWVDPAAPATVAIVWRLLQQCGMACPTEAALCLFVGLVTDTGGFTFSNANPWAFEMAADLCGRGVSAAAVDGELNAGLPLPYVNLLGAALAATRSEGGIVYTAVSQDMLARCGAADEDLEGVVDYTRRVQGCRVGILFRELDDGGVKVSFRAAGELDVRELAVAHGGGGHAAAAGCRVEGPLEKAQATIIAEVAAWLRKQLAA